MLRLFDIDVRPPLTTSERRRVRRALAADARRAGRYGWPGHAELVARRDDVAVYVDDGDGEDIYDVAQRAATIIREITRRACFLNPVVEEPAC